MSEIIFSAAAFIVALGALVTFHEYGHYWVARRLNVKVLRFSIGFGRPLWQRTAGADNTEYVIAAIPLGGYVKMLDEREGPVAPEERARAFNTQSLSRRTAIVVAGPLFNFILAIVAYWFTFVIGINGITPLLGEVDPESAAGRAGFQLEDRVLSVNGEATPTWSRVRIVILEQALDSNDPLLIQVHDAQGNTVSRSLALPQRSLLQDEGDFVAELGFVQWFPDVAPRIGGLLDEHAAERAGILVGDLVLRADGVSIDTWREWVTFVRARPLQDIDLVVQRGDSEVQLLLRPDLKDTGPEQIGYIGAYEVESRALLARMRTTVRYSPLQAVGEALGRTWGMTSLTLRVLGKLITGEAALRNISGPITIAQYAGQSASIGIDHYLNFLALISISLGVLNLLPIPVLDGGHLLYFLMEAVTRRPISERVQMYGQQIGLVILFGLMGLAFYNDIARLMG
ncbi:MAG: RIP metalloprotease RseP [Gammaproteobacteria bacterium]|nr:RIP metalloprotease RseP [Gammaproteobacteria bacterium]